MNQESPSAVTLDPSEAARVIGVTKSTFYRLLAANRIPKPIRLTSRQPRWLRAELIGWLEAGGPSAGEWQLLKATAGGRS